MENRKAIIKKYSLPQNDQEWIIEVPFGAKVLSAIINEGNQTISLYFLCNEGEVQFQKRKFVDIGTGRTYDADCLDHIATLSQHEGFIIHHIFETYVAKE